MMRMTVADLMCEEPVTIDANANCDSALELFYDLETPELYVLDAVGRLIGVLPDYEVIKVQLSGEAHGARVERFMSPIVRSVTPESDAADLARMFRDSSCSRIPVVKSGKLLGLVTRTDIIRTMAVLKRIASTVPTVTSSPKRPKMLGPEKLTNARTARPKSTNSAAKPVTDRPRNVARRSTRLATR